MDLKPVFWTTESATATFDTGGIHFYFTLLYLDRLTVLQ